MAGTVRGSRQMNSTVRVSPGSRSRTQVIVGTSSASMTTTVNERERHGREEALGAGPGSGGDLADVDEGASRCRPVRPPADEVRVVNSSIP
jgi:hypothetical protein